MLRVIGVSAGRAPYYLTDRAPELDTLLGKPAPGPVGRWWGSGARDLGLVGAVDGAPFSALLGGRHPANGRPLAGRATANGAFDLTFGAPKSISVLCALGTPAVAASVLEAHDEAVEAVLGYLQARALAVRRQVGDERVTIRTHGLAAATFRHGASRTGDPHLHTHAVVPNVAHGTDGRWSAIDSRGLHRHAAAGGALYRAHLRHSLSRRLGVAWRDTGHGYEVEGIDPVVIGAFSGRRADVVRQLAEHRAGSARARRVAADVTRPPKSPAPDRRRLPGAWAGRAGALGLGPDEVAKVTGRQVAADIGPADGIDERRFAWLLLGDHDHPLTRRRVLEVWSESLRAGSPAAEVDGSVEHWAPAPAGPTTEEPTLWPRDVVAPSYVVRALGPRPAIASAQPIFRGAAGHITRYRARWSVDDRGEPLGVAPSAVGRSTLPVRRLADHLATERVVAEARRDLGREVGRDALSHDRALGHGR